MLNAQVTARRSAGPVTFLVLAAVPFLAAAATDVPAASAPRANAKPAAGSLEVTLLSPNERTEEPLTVWIAPIPENPKTGPGRPTAEKKLTLPPRPKKGRVTFDDLRAGQWLLSWSGPSVGEGERGFTIGAGAAATAEIVLRSGRTLRGSVRDDLGMVLEGVRVRVVPAAEPFVDSSLPTVTALSGADGTFTLAGLPGEGALTWEATSEGHVPATGRLGGDTRLEIVLDRAQRIRGRVVDADGAPIDRADLHPFFVQKREDGRIGAKRPNPVPIHTDEMGRFAFDRTLPWPGSVRVRARGFLTKTVGLEALVSLDEAKELDLGAIALEKGRTVTGRVFAAKGNEPVAGARVVATWTTGAGHETVRDGTEALADDEGGFELTGLPFVGNVRVVASAPSFARSSSTLDAEATSVDLLLRRGGRIEGQVCGTPAELARSWIWYGAGGQPVSSVNEIEVDAAGRFVFDNAEPGVWTLQRVWKFRDASGAKRGGVGGVISPTARVTVEEGVTARVRLACDGIPVSGTLSANGAPLGDRVLVLAKANRAFGEGFVDGGTGAFTVRVPASGLWVSWGSVPPKGMSFAAPGCEVPPEGLAACSIDLTPVPISE